MALKEIIISLFVCFCIFINACSSKKNEFIRTPPPPIETETVEPNTPARVSNETEQPHKNLEITLKTEKTRNEKSDKQNSESNETISSTLDMKNETLKNQSLTLNSTISNTPSKKNEKEQPHKNIEPNTPAKVGVETQHGNYDDERVPQTKLSRSLKFVTSLPSAIWKKDRKWLKYFAKDKAGRLIFYTYSTTCMVVLPILTVAAICNNMPVVGVMIGTSLACSIVHTSHGHVIIHRHLKSLPAWQQRL